MHKRRGEAVFLIKLGVVASQDMMRITTWAAKVFASFEKKIKYLLMLTKLFASLAKDIQASESPQPCKVNYVFLVKWSLKESQSGSYDGQVGTDSNPDILMFINVV